MRGNLARLFSGAKCMCLSCCLMLRYARLANDETDPVCFAKFCPEGDGPLTPSTSVRFCTHTTFSFAVSLILITSRESPWIAAAACCLSSGHFDGYTLRLWVLYVYAPFSTPASGTYSSLVIGDHLRHAIGASLVYWVSCWQYARHRTAALRLGTSSSILAGLILVW